MKSIRRVLQGNLLVFTLGNVMRQLSLFITFPYFSLYIKALGGGVIDIGLVNSLLFLAALFVYPIAGSVADRYSRVKIIAASEYISAALLLIFALAPDWKILALGNFLNGLMVFTFPAYSALIADSLPLGQRGVGYSLVIAIPSAVGIISPYVGGYLITILGVEKAMRTLYGLTVVVSLGTATMDLKLLNETKANIGKESSEKEFTRILSDSYRDMFEVLKWLPNSLKAFALMLVLSFFINSVIGPYWIIYGLNEIGLSELQWGTILLVAMVVNVSFLIPAGIIVDKLDVKKLLAFALAVSAAPIFLFPLSQGFKDTVLLFVVMSIANTFLISGAPTFMAHSVPSDKRGRVMAVLGQGMLLVNIRGGGGGVAGPGMGAILAIPSILGSIIGGFVYNYNPTLPWFLLAASLFVNAVIATVFLSSIKNPTS